MLASWDHLLVLRFSITHAKDPMDDASVQLYFLWLCEQFDY